MKTTPRLKYEFQNAAPGSEGEAELLIYDDIGEGFFSEGVTARQFARDLKALGDVKAIRVRINSLGGNTADAAAIYNQLAQHGATINVDVDGVALSSASYIAMAGDRIRMAENALMMIHDPWTLAMGDAGDLRKTADMLDKTRDTIASIYVARTGKDRDTINQMMADETWMDAAEAIERGFADEMTEAKRIAARVDPSQFLNVPERFRHVFDTKAPGATPADRKDDDMPSNQPVMNAAEFAEKNPDAVKQWKDEGATEVLNKYAKDFDAAIADNDRVKAEYDTRLSAAIDDATKDERGRCQSLAKAFAAYPAFLAEQIAKGHDVAKAKAEAFDAKLHEAAGADPLALDPGASIDKGKERAYDGLDLQQRIEAEWQNNEGKCQAKYKHQYAYAAYRQSQERAKATKQPAA